MRNLTLEGGIVVFKMLAISKIVFLALLTKISHQVVKESEKIQKFFLWQNSAPKIKHETTCKDYKDGGLENVDISCKIVSLQYSSSPKTPACLILHFFFFFFNGLISIFK